MPQEFERNKFFKKLTNDINSVFLNCFKNALIVEDKKEARNQLQFTITEKGFLYRKNIDSKILQRFRSCLVQNLFLIHL